MDQTVESLRWSVPHCISWSQYESLGMAWFDWDDWGTSLSIACPLP